MHKLRSVGLDVGTSTTQLILSELTVENKGSSFSVPDMVIGHRQVVYKSPVHFTPLLDKNHVDGQKIREILELEYENAGIRPQDVDTGAIIITGETSRKENARAVLEALEAYAGEFVVATAGPDLESVLAAKGAGADSYSRDTGKRVLHLDIGGGTSNLVFLEDGKILKTGCLNVGGRLIKLNKNGEITYISPVLQGIFHGKVGERPGLSQLEELCQTLTQALEMAAGLRPATQLLEKLTTSESSSGGLAGAEVFSFSGGVADCIGAAREPFAFGDLGPILGACIRQSRLCAGSYRLGTETIRATVIGAGCHAAQLSGSTVYYRDVQLPVKNLPVMEIEGMDAPQIRQARDVFDVPPVLALPGPESPSYQAVTQLADTIAALPGPKLVALQGDFAKALGHALALRTEDPILCIDRVKLENGSYLDVGAPVSSALPVVIKTLVLQREEKMSS